MTVKKENRLIVCVYTKWKSTKRWTALIPGVITKQQVSQ